MPQIHRQVFEFGPRIVPHRKNAAEWMIWIVLAPIAWICSLFVAE
jgi:hypothetical protein